MEEEEIEYGMILDEVEGEGGEYIPRLKNSKKDPVQRTNVTGFDRRLPMVVYGKREDTIHGTNSKGTPCSLIVFGWYLHQRELKKRFKSLRIVIVFSATRKKGNSIDHWYDPHVGTVAPNGTYSLVPTTKTTEAKASVEGNLGGGFGGVSAGAKVGYELTQSVETTDRVIINGTEYPEYEGEEDPGNPDRCNAVEFNLFENDSQQSGLPTFFRTAVLLERRKRDNQRFTAAVTTIGKVGLVDDAITSLKSLVGIIPKDEPIIFDPNREERSQFTKFKSRLDEVSLEDYCKFVMYKTERAPRHSSDGHTESGHESGDANKQEAKE